MAVLERLESLPRPAAAGLAVALTLAIGVADWATGYQFAFAVFYLPPVVLTAWLLGRRSALLAALMAAVVWLVANRLAGEVWISPVSAGWNAGVRFGLFAAVAVAVAALRRTLLLLAQAVERERNLARVDTLTGVANARAFREQAGAELLRATRFGRPVALAYIDADGFKAVNDTRGHATGDAVLQRIGHALAASQRRMDVVARMGGDEFVVLLPETGHEAAQAAVEKLRAVLTAEMAKDGTPVTFSIGVVTAAAAAELDTLLGAADRLMYGVKHGGKDGVRIEPLPPVVGDAR